MIILEVLEGVGLKVNSHNNNGLRRCISKFFFAAREIGGRRALCYDGELRLARTRIDWVSRLWGQNKGGCSLARSSSPGGPALPACTGTSPCPRDYINSCMSYMYIRDIN